MPDSDKDIINDAVQQFINDKLQGQEPNLDEFVKNYPGYEYQIRQKIEKIQKIDGLFSGLMQADDSDYTEPVVEHDLIGQTLGDFEILNLIGAGGMGAVFLARQISLDREVALKVISDVSGARGKSLERFKREAKVLAKISHPNIVPVYEVGEQGPYSYFAMEYVRGFSLDRILTSIRNAPHSEKASKVLLKCLENKAGFSENGITSPEGKRGAEIDTEYIVTISKMIISVAFALDYAHEKGILHRDVKPSNIIIASNGTPKLVDFGLAKAETQQTVTMTGEFFGTPSYVSPEQIRKPETVDCRSDVYSLAATYYECLTLHAPFEGNTVNETLTQVISKEVIPPKKHCPRLSIDFNTVLLHALEKVPQDRYQTALEFATDIQNVLDFKPIFAKRPSITQRTYRILRRNPLKIAVMGVSILVVVLGYFLISNHMRDKNITAAKNLQAVAAREMVIGNYTKAIELYKESIELYPLDAKAYIEIGHCYRNLKQYPEAIEAFSQAITINPNNTDAIGALGDTYAFDRKYEEAIEVYQNLILQNPNDFDAYYNLGYVNNELDQYTQAIEAFKKAIEVDPNKADSYNELGCVYHSLGRYEDAIQACEQAIKIDPNSRLAYITLGAAYSGNGQHAQAIEPLKKAFKMKPDDNKTLGNLGVVYSDLGRYEEAIAFYKEMLLLDPNNAATYNVCGDALDQSGRHTEAIDAYKRAILEDPNFVLAYINLGHLYTDLERYEDAEKSFREAIRINPNQDDSYFGLGFVYERLGNYEKAIEHFKQAIAVEPNDINNYITLGLAFGNSHRDEEAIAVYRQATEIDPNFSTAYRWLGLSYSLLSRYDEAIEAYQKAINLGLNDAHLYNDIADAYFQLRYFEKALEYNKKAISLEPNEPDFYIDLGFIYGMSLQNDKLIESFIQACKLTDFKDHHYIADLARAYAELGDFEKAIEYQEKALELADENVKAEYERRLEAYKSKKPWRSGQNLNEKIMNFLNRISTPPD